VVDVGNAAILKKGWGGIESYCVVVGEGYFRGVGNDGYSEGEYCVFNVMGTGYCVIDDRVN
jgi:hypothetical protein